MVKGLVSVIMSNYNTHEEYLRIAIESVLNQSYKNFEFIIVDDCSTDNSLNVIESYADERIIILKNEENLGITKSLNRALRVAKGEFVARMDADDICLFERFEKQVSYLKNNPETIVCGSAVEFIGDISDKRTVFAYREISDRQTFQICLFFANNPNIVHPSAMFNNVLLKKYGIQYNENYKYAQDYRMWVECSRWGECTNIPETLFQYRLHSGAVSSGKKAEQRNCMRNILAEQLMQIGINATEQKLDIHENLLFGRQSYNIAYKKWIRYLIKQNKKYSYFNHKKLKNILHKKWAEITYFGLASDKKAREKVNMLFNLSIFNYIDLLRIRMDRTKKNKTN